MTIILPSSIFEWLAYIFVITAFFILGGFIHSFFQKPGHLISKTFILVAILLFLLYLVSGWTFLLAYIFLILFILLLPFFLTMYFEWKERLEHEACLDEYVQIRHSNKNSENYQPYKQSSDLASNENYQSCEETSNLASKEYHQSCKETSDLTSKEKGDLFEHYVIRRFSRRYFLLKDMRSDKGSDGIYPESNQYPDLVFEYKPESFIFAVECKWRAGWWLRDDNRYLIDCMGGDHKLEVYNRFSKQYDMPVWIVLGVAGQPDNPVELYSIPLHALKYRYAEFSYLQQFQHKDVHKNFYLDTRYYTLR